MILNGHLNQMNNSKIKNSVKQDVNYLKLSFNPLLDPLILNSHLNQINNYTIKNSVKQDVNILNYPSTLSWTHWFLTATSTKWTTIQSKTDSQTRCKLSETILPWKQHFLKFMKCNSSDVFVVPRSCSITIVLGLWMPTS
jgi:hypothetical protein